MRSKKDWKNELQNQLGDGFIVYNPQMPNKQNAQYAEWKIFFEKIMNLVNENVILIGHSMGGIFLAKYLSENDVLKKIKKTFLISAPFDNEELTHESLVSFLRGGDLKNLEKQAGQIYLYHSEDDTVVPFSHLEKYVRGIVSPNVRVLKDKGHFNKLEEIPGLLDDLIL